MRIIRTHELIINAYTFSGKFAMTSADADASPVPYRATTVDCCQQGEVMPGLG